MPLQRHVTYSNDSVTFKRAKQASAEGMEQVYTWLKAGALKFDLEIVALREIESAWERGALPGQRIVIVPQEGICLCDLVVLCGSIFSLHRSNVVFLRGRYM